MSFTYTFTHIVHNFTTKVKCVYGICNWVYIIDIKNQNFVIECI